MGNVHKRRIPQGDLLTRNLNHNLHYNSLECNHLHDTNYMKTEKKSSPLPDSAEKQFYQRHLNAFFRRILGHLGEDLASGVISARDLYAIAADMRKILYP